MENIKPFSIDVSDTALSDLQHRLEHSRWPDEISNSDWNYGTNLTYLKDLAEYWKTQFSWREQEVKLNAFKHYISKIDGLNIHFIYERGKGPNPLPLIISHGWPSSFIEMITMIPMLTDPAKYGGDPNHSFDVIVPSMPGFGFSDCPTEQGFGIQKIADIVFKLMTEVLGYERFYAHGGDFGTRVTARLGFTYPNHVMAIHTNSVNGFTPGRPYPGTRSASAIEENMFAARAKWLEGEGGYSHIQSTKPQTVAYGLNDSPIGLAAYLIEKYRGWSDCNGEIETRFSRDELLTMITLYWLTQTINSSMRLYYECRANPWVLSVNEKITVPCAVACFTNDNVPLVKEWAERFYNLQRWTEFSRGGHFPAFEEPELLANDIRAFFYHLA
ncbi:MAG: epoxide hydrolase [Gammaproteobacteria bacterium]|nr:epoxide hydrolase [Gammaproteobacteria bacterium]